MNDEVDNGYNDPKNTAYVVGHDDVARLLPEQAPAPAPVSNPEQEAEDALEAQVEEILQQPVEITKQADGNDGRTSEGTLNLTLEEAQAIVADSRDFTKSFAAKAKDDVVPLPPPQENGEK
jgi:hypothetical protein